MRSWPAIWSCGRERGGGILDRAASQPVSRVLGRVHRVSAVHAGRRSALSGLAARSRGPIATTSRNSRTRPTCAASCWWIRAARWTYGSPGYTKAEYARTLAATLGYFLGKQGDAVGLLTFDEASPRISAAAQSARAFAASDARAGEAADGQRDGFRRAAAADGGAHAETRADGADFRFPLAAGEPGGRALALTAARHEVLVFHLLDPAERNFAFEQPCAFRDMETRAARSTSTLPWRVPNTRAGLAAHQAESAATLRTAGRELIAMGDGSNTLELALFGFPAQPRPNGASQLRRQMRAYGPHLQSPAEEGECPMHRTARHLDSPRTGRNYRAKPGFHGHVWPGTLSTPRPGCLHPERT